MSPDDQTQRPPVGGGPPVSFSRIADDVTLGRNVRVVGLCNLYGCTIGDETMVGSFVEIQKGATIGRRVKIQSHTFICTGVHVADEAFIGHGVMFINDRFPRATNDDGSLQGAADWKCEPTRVGRRASIGSNSTILCGVVIGDEAIVGAGSVVTKNVPARTVVAGNPARILRCTIDARSDFSVANQTNNSVSGSGRPSSRAA
jgi:acetyltransferase-like isoleucine patch superfamily enzyme